MAPPHLRRLIISLDVKLVLLLLLFFFNKASSQSVIENLPGFPGKLPFRLETGYIGVGDSEEVQLFYYFIESERNPDYDPLILWLMGGPGCSGLSAIVYEIGPLTFDFANSNGSIPTLTLKPYSWTKLANIIFLDKPAGCGFSYAKTPEAYKTNDLLSGKHTYEFLKKWLINHPKYMENPLYIGGESYSGISVPIVVNEVYNGIEVGSGPLLNLKGYILGNPFTDIYSDFNGKIAYAHRMGLLQITSTRALVWFYATRYVIMAHAFEGRNSWTSVPFHAESWCRDDNYRLVNNWANHKSVQKALHVREGTITEWARCNNTIHYKFDYNQSASYTFNIKNTVNYHKKFSHKKCRALIYSGDHDMAVAHTRTEEWINSLKLVVQSDWRPWFMEDQIAGYTTAYCHDDYELIYATVKGAGHTGPEYKPQECFFMVERWLSGSPL